MTLWIIIHNFIYINILYIHDANITQTEASGAHWTSCWRPLSVTQQPATPVASGSWLQTCGFPKIGVPQNHSFLPDFPFLSQPSIGITPCTETSVYIRIQLVRKFIEHITLETPVVYWITKFFMKITEKMSPPRYSTCRDSPDEQYSSLPQGPSRIPSRQSRTSPRTCPHPFLGCKAG